MMILGQYRSVLVDTLWCWVSMERYWVSMEWYWFIYDGTGSEWVNSCWFLVILDQCRAVMVDTRRY